MSLQVKDLSIARGGVPVLTGVGFSLLPKHAIVLRGPNGSGKTTLLRTLAGLQPALSGSITGAQDQVAYAGHADGVKDMLSVAENLSFWAAVYGQREIAAALDAFELDKLRHRLAGTLSAGQKRRLGLARLLVTGRAIWMLDEPTVSLDSDATALFVAALRRHLDRGGMAVIATHIPLDLEADLLDLAPFRARRDTRSAASDEAFL